MKRIRKGLCLLLLAAALLAAGISPAAAQSAGAAVQVLPDALQMAPGEEREVAIEVADVADLYGFDLSVRFDPAVLQVVDADENRRGTQVAQGTFLDAGMIAANSADNTTGEITFVMTQLNPSTPKSGGGALVVIRFRALKAGGSTIGIDEALLSTATGKPIDATVKHGSVTVLSATQQVAQPTPTAMPVEEDSQYIPTAAPTTAVPTAAGTAPEPGATPTPLQAEPTLEATQAAGGLRINTPRAVVTSTVPAPLTPTAGAQPTSAPDAADSTKLYWLGGIGALILAALIAWAIRKRA